jgi:RHS repeat-associated protein
MNDGVGSENYTYNNLEQLTQLQKVIIGSTYTTSYAYNFASQLTSITYPSGRVVQQSVDAVGRLCEVAPSTTGCGTATSPFATGFRYSPASQVTGLQYGNGIYGSFGFTADRLQLNCLDYSTTNRGGTCTHDGTTKFGLNYSYYSSPNNNGLITGITDSVDSGRSASYTYDPLYRLLTATTAGSANYPAWGLSQTYDRYGNRSAQTAIPGAGCVAIACPQPSFGVNTSTNRVIGSPYAYDLSGNMTDDGINTLVYDAENHVTSATNGGSAGAYLYDGNGLRVKRCVPNCTSPTTTTVYFFSGSKVLAEYDNGAAVASPSREYVYAGAALLARIDSSATKYYHQDHLSNRLVTDSSGNTLAQMGTFPFGESWYNASNDKLLFTTYERDSESGNDYAQARYNVSGLGRFSSPDPIAGSTSDPQSLNRYSYVRNMPVMLTDPFGTCPGGLAQNRNPDSIQSQDSKSGGPSADGPGSEENADPQLAPQIGSFQFPCQGFTVQGGGGGVSIDGGEVFSPGDGASGLIGSGDSNGSVSVGGGAGGWVPDGTGGYYNPGTGCYTNRSQIVCNWQGYEETFGDGSSELDMLSLGGSRASWKEVFGALDRASARLAALAGGLMWMPDAVVDCADDLTAMGIDGSMVAKGALDAVFNNGVGSAVLASTLYASAPNPTLARLAPTVTGTIGDIFARNAGTVAVSQLGGNNIYFNPAMMDPGNVMGTLFHEVVHNVSGLTDSDIQRALNLPESPATKNITDKLMKDCF